MRRCLGARCLTLTGKCLIEAPIDVPNGAQEYTA